MVWEFQNLAPSLHVPQPQEVTHPPGSERKYLLPGSRRTLLVCKNILYYFTLSVLSQQIQDDEQL